MVETTRDVNDDFGGCRRVILVKKRRSINEAPLPFIP